MKKLAFVFMALLIVASSCKKKDDDTVDPNALNPTASQKGFCIEYTSTTCSICGSKGGPLIHKYAKDAPNSVVVALHVNGNHDPMANNSLSYGFSDRPSGGGIPSFWVGDTKTSTSDDNAMLDLVATGDAVAGVDVKYSIDGTTMTVETLTKFFSAAAGNYYLSVYVLEDGIDGSSTAPTGYVQPGASYSYPNDDYKHDFVMRAATLGNVYGELIYTNPAKDTEVSKSYTITLDASWEKTLYAVAVLWKFDPSGTPEYSFVNAMRR